MTFNSAFYILHPAFERAVLLVFFLIGTGWAASPYEAVQQGNARYEDGQYEAAAGHYASAAKKLPDAPEIQFNQGNAFYKQQDYGQALEHYSRVLPTADPGFESRTKYNLGNVKYQQALQALQQPQEAIPHLHSAMTYYRDSLEVDPQQQQARYNLELAQRLLRQLQPPPQSQQGQQNQRDQQQQSQQQDQQQQQASQESQDQSTESAAQDQESSDDTETQSQLASAPQTLTPEEAQRLLDVIRERAREADDLRQERRRASIHDARVNKDW